MLMLTMGRKRRPTNAEYPTPNPHGKRRRHSIVAFEMVRLNRAAAEPLHQQLYRQIRDELASGSFNNNSSRLPSSRALAADFGVSRFTVNLALSRLHAEGYLQSKIGSGTFISEALPETFPECANDKSSTTTERPSRLSNRVKDIPDHRVGKQFDFGIAGPPGVSFVPAVAALDEFPSKFGNDSEHKFSHKRSASAPVCVKPWRSRVAQGVGNLFV
jgi:GntR family transcriptional regulator/MocR family aminotransferase